MVFKIIQIQIRIVFTLKLSADYEYHYSVKTIQILFEYQSIRSHLMRGKGMQKQTTQFHNQSCWQLKCEDLALRIRLQHFDIRKRQNADMQKLFRKSIWQSRLLAMQIWGFVGEEVLTIRAISNYNIRGSSVKNISAISDS